MRRLLAVFALTAACGHGSPDAALHAPPPRPADLPKLDANSAVACYIMMVDPEDDATKGDNGTGFVVSEEGHILTARHVVATGRPVVVRIGDAEYPARIVSTDFASDMALIKIERRFEQVAVFEDPENIHEGDPVYTIGWPYDVGRVVWRGFIAKLHADDPRNNRKNTTLLDTQNGHGVSGAPVASAASGKVIGMMRSVFTRAHDDVPPTVFHSAIAVEDLAAFLRQHGLRPKTLWPEEAAARLKPR